MRGLQMLQGTRLPWFKLLSLAWSTGGSLHSIRGTVVFQCCVQKIAGTTWQREKSNSRIQGFLQLNRAQKDMYVHPIVSIQSIHRFVGENPRARCFGGESRSVEEFSTLMQLSCSICIVVRSSPIRAIGPLC